MIQKTTPGDGYGEEVAELAYAHHPYRFEVDDTSSADHSESSNKENELQEDWLIDIPFGNRVNQIFPLYFLAVSDYTDALKI